MCFPQTQHTMRPILPVASVKAGVDLPASRLERPAQRRLRLGDLFGHRFGAVVTVAQHILDGAGSLRRQRLFTGDPLAAGHLLIKHPHILRVGAGVQIRQRHPTVAGNVAERRSAAAAFGPVRSLASGGGVEVAALGLKRLMDHHGQDMLTFVLRVVVAAALVIVAVTRPFDVVDHLVMGEAGHGRAIAVAGVDLGSGVIAVLKVIGDLALDNQPGGPDDPALVGQAVGQHLAGDASGVGVVVIEGGPLSLDLVFGTFGEPGHLVAVADDVLAGGAVKKDLA